MKLTSSSRYVKQQQASVSVWLDTERDDQQMGAWWFSNVTMLSANQITPFAECSFFLCPFLKLLPNNIFLNTRSKIILKSTKILQNLKTSKIKSKVGKSSE